MKRPDHAIDRFRAFLNGAYWGGEDGKIFGARIVDYFEWLKGKHVCQWPEKFTKEYLSAMADHVAALRVANNDWPQRNEVIVVLRAFAALAPEREKRVVHLWQHVDGSIHGKPLGWHPSKSGEWIDIVKHNVELYSDHDS
jgi:hypothetical protein